MDTGYTDTKRNADTVCVAKNNTIISVSQETLGILRDAYDELVSFGCLITGGTPILTEDHNAKQDIRRAEPDCFSSNININRDMAHEIHMQISAIRRLFE